MAHDFRSLGQIHCCFSLYFVLPAFTPVPSIRPQSGRHRGDGAHTVHPKGSRNKNSVAVREWTTGIVEDPEVQARLLADARAGKLHPSVLTVLMTYAYGRPNLRDVPEPETPITIELNIPKPPGVMRTDSTG